MPAVRRFVGSVDGRRAAPARHRPSARRHDDDARAHATRTRGGAPRTLCVISESPAQAMHLYSDILNINSEMIIKTLSTTSNTLDKSLSTPANGNALNTRGILARPSACGAGVQHALHESGPALADLVAPPTLLPLTYRRQPWTPARASTRPLGLPTRPTTHARA